MRTAARTAHAGLFSAGGRTVIVSVPDVGVLLKSAVAKANPGLAEKIPPKVQGVLASLGGSHVDRVVLRLFNLSRRLVLVLVVEDYVSPQDLAAEFAASGLDGLVYQGPVGPPWPTLREMIDPRQRVLVLTESGRPGVAWIHPAFAVMQETPYDFEHPSELVCAPNRGETAGPLFLMNNWIDSTPAPKPSNALIVNAYDALLARAKQCQTERGKMPTVIAVDFYRTGALFRVARTLNGVAGASPD